MLLVNEERILVESLKLLLRRIDMDFDTFVFKFGLTIVFSIIIAMNVIGCVLVGYGIGHFLL